MNLIDAEVIEVLSEPEYKKEVFEDSTYRYWTVKVKVVDEGGEKTENLSFDNKDLAEKVSVGYKFLH